MSPGRPLGGNRPGFFLAEKPQAYGEFWDTLRHTYWGVSGHAPHETPYIQHRHFRRGNCTCAQHCVVELEAGRGDPQLSLTATLPGLLIYRRGFSLGNFGTCQPYKTAWRSGAMPMPELTKRFTSNTVIIGAVIALAYSNTLSQRPGRVAVVL